MKKELCFITLVFWNTYNVSAQDILTKRNGDEIEVKVLKISDSEVEYKKWSNPNGPSYTVSKSDVFMIKYKNGEKDVFSDTPSASADKQNSQKQVQGAPQKAEPTDENASLTEQYNKYETIVAEYTQKRKDKKCKRWWGTLGVANSSVLSSNDIRITIFNEEKSRRVSPYKYNGEILSGIINEKQGTFFHGKYIIEISNNTSQTIYIDKAESFKIEPDGNYHMYYNTQQVTTNQGGGSGGSINLGAVTGIMGIGGAASTLAGGINVGGGKQSSVSTTYADQRVIAIPPHGKMALSKDEIIPIKKAVTGWDKYKMTSFSEDFSNCKITEPALQQGEYRAFSEEESPASKKYIITYYTDPEFNLRKQQEFTVYIKEAIGCLTDLGGFVTDRLMFPNKNLLEAKSDKTIIIGGDM